MKPPPRHVHILGATRDIQSLQLTRKLGSVRGLNSRLGPLEEEAFDAFVAEALNHTPSVSCHDTRVNRCGIGTASTAKSGRLSLRSQSAFRASLAASEWIDDYGLTWLAAAPKIKL